MPQNHDDASFVNHKTDWIPGQEGKGFIVRPTQLGIKNWPQLAGAQPLIWTWPTQGMEPIHNRVKQRTRYEVPQGMAPDPTSYFHIQPDGGVYQFGSGRKLSDDDHAAINGADSRLNPVGAQPKVQSDGYGHANRLLEILGAIRRGRWSEIPKRWRRVTAGGDWFAPSYGIPNDVKEQIHEWGKQLPWDTSAKLQDPSKYHITSFYSQNGYADPSHHQWVQGESGLRYPAYTHSLDTFTGHDPGGLQPVVMRFHAPELSAHAESLMDTAEKRGLPVSRFDGGHKPHITLGHNPESFPVEAPHIEFETEPMHELHSYYDSLKNA